MTGRQERSFQVRLKYWQALCQDRGTDRARRGSGCKFRPRCCQKAGFRTDFQRPERKWYRGCQAAGSSGSPDRGALGRTGKFCCSLGPNWAQSAGPCSNGQRLRDSALTEGAGQASVNLDRGARPFPIAENFARPARPLPTRQWLPYQGSWREAPERLYKG